MPLMLRDGLTSQQQAVRDAVLHDGSDHLLVTDAAGGSAGLHRPGFRLVADAAARKRSVSTKEAAYRAADEADANACRGNAPRPKITVHDRLDQITHDRLSLLYKGEKAYIEAELPERLAQPEMSHERVT